MVPTGMVHSAVTLGRPQAKHLAYILSFNPPNRQRKAETLSQVSRRGHKGSERLGTLPQVTQRVSHKAKLMAGSPQLHSPSPPPRCCGQSLSLQDFSPSKK